MFFEGKNILVIGGTGSMGRILVQRILMGKMGNPKKIIVFSRDEAKQHDMRMSYLHKIVATDEVIYRNFMSSLEFRIGDVRNYADICSAIKDADIVVNAAALKQVPTCEYFPSQAVLTNCIGPANIVRAIEENKYPVDTVITISTDKACKPINVMGMTKSIQERIFIVANILNPNTRFICVRYGNVLASRGSVIPLFHEQIKNGGPVTVTVPEMTRFLLSFDQAADTVFQALREANRGEIYIPIASSASVINIAKALVGDHQIGIKITGIRPGEKMHEILVSEEEVNRCVKRGEYYAIQPMLPELRDEEKQEPVAIVKEYNSADQLLDLPGTIALLNKNNLMIDDAVLQQNNKLFQ